MPGIEKKGRSKIASYKKESGPCWSGYEMIGMKSKGGKKVPNCVPKKANKGLLAEKKTPPKKTPPIEQQDTPKKFQDTIDKAKKFKNKKPIPGDPRKRRKQLIDIQNPVSEYDKKGKLKYTAAKHGTMVRGGGAAIRGLKFQGVK